VSKGSKSRPDASTAMTRRPTSQVAEGLRQQVTECFESMNESMRKLSADLARWRQRCGELQRERDQLLATISSSEVERAQSSQEALQWQVLQAERDRLQQSLEALQQENQRLVQECARITRDLDEEQRRRLTIQVEVACLEEQVSHLQCMLDLLRRAEGATGPGDS